MATPVILLVDDDRLVLATLGKGLRKAGYDTLEASSGEEALRLCGEARPALAILDARMPGLSGAELARKLQAQFGIPFIMLSAYGDTALVQQALAEGALGYLVKPLDVPQVVPAIEAAMRCATHIHELQSAKAQLAEAVAADRDTSAAVGLLMERYRLSNTDAFQMLRMHARSQRRKLREVAHEMIRAAEVINLPRHDPSKPAPQANPPREKVG